MLFLDLAIPLGTCNDLFWPLTVTMQCTATLWSVTCGWSPAAVPAPRCYKISEEQHLLPVHSPLSLNPVFVHTLYLFSSRDTQTKRSSQADCVYKLHCEESSVPTRVYVLGLPRAPHAEPSLLKRWIMKRWRMSLGRCSFRVLFSRHHT